MVAITFTVELVPVEAPATAVISAYPVFLRLLAADRLVDTQTMAARQSVAERAMVP
jgi:hypothetical protein